MSQITLDTTNCRDFYVRDDAPTSNYCNDVVGNNTFGPGISLGNVVFRVGLWFDILGNVPGSKIINSAKLYVKSRITNNPGTRITDFEVANVDEDGKECAYTWNDVDGWSAVYTQSIVLGKWNNGEDKDYDLTNLVKYIYSTIASNRMIIIKARDESAFSNNYTYEFTRREGGSGGPRLVINYSDVGAIGSLQSGKRLIFDYIPKNVQNITQLQPGSEPDTKSFAWDYTKPDDYDEYVTYGVWVDGKFYAEVYDKYVKIYGIRSGVTVQLDIEALPHAGYRKTVPRIDVPGNRVKLTWRALKPRILSDIRWFQIEWDEGADDGTYLSRPLAYIDAETKQQVDHIYPTEED